MVDINAKKPISKNVLEYFTKVLPFLVILAIFSGVMLSLALDRVDLFIRGLSVAFPAFFAAVILNFIYKKSADIKDYSYFLIKVNEKTCIKLFFIFYLLSIISLLVFNVRSPYYFIFLILLYFFVFVHIFISSINYQIVLLEIFLILLNSIYSVTLIYPLYFGGTDILPHLFFTKLVLLSGTILPGSSVGYENFPLFHIFISQATYLTNLSIQSSYFLIAAPSFAISVFFIYYISFRLSNDIRISLLSSFFFSILSVTIYSGMYMVTRTMAFVGFIILLYLIYSINNNNSKIHNMLLKSMCLLLGLFIILVHQVSTPQIVSIMILISLVEIILYKMNLFKKMYISRTYILILLVGFISYWFFVGSDFVDALATIYIDSTKYESLVIKSVIQAGNEWMFIINNIDNSAITFLSIIGIGVTLYFYKKSYILILAIVSLLILPLYIPNPLQMLWNTMTLFRFDRYMLLVSPFIALMMAVGLCHLNKMFRYNAVNKIHFFTLALLLIFIITSGSIISSAPEPYNSERRYFEVEELVAFEHVLNHIAYGERVYSDYFTRRFFTMREFNESEDIGFPFYSPSSLDIYNINKTEGYIILRKKAFYESGLRLGDGNMVNVRPVDLLEWNRVNLELEKKNKLYCNSNTVIFK